MTTALNVLLAGEGPNELGSLAREVPYRVPVEVGVLEALVRRFTSTPFVALDGTVWRRIRKFQVGRHRSAEKRAILGLALQGKERGFDVVVFVRDADADADRPRDVEAALAEVDRVIDGAPRMVGAVAVRALEAWLVALAGRSGSEALSMVKLEEEVARLPCAWKQTLDYVDHVQRTSSVEPAHDNASLAHFRERVERAFGEP